MDKNLKRVAMSAADAEWLLRLIQAHCMNEAINNRSNIEASHHSDVIKRIKHASES